MTVLLMPDRAVLTPQGNLFEGPESDALEEELAASIAEGPREIVVDLAKVEHLSGRAIGILASAQRRAMERGSRIVVLTHHEDQFWLCHITHLDDVLEVRPPRTKDGQAAA